MVASSKKHSIDLKRPMNEGSLSSKAWLNLGIFTALLAGGVWWIQSPLTSSRPSGLQTSKLIDTSFPTEKPFARQWQDPFEPYFEYTKLLESRSQSSDKTNSEEEQKTSHECDLIRIFRKDFEKKFPQQGTPKQCEPKQCEQKQCGQKQCEQKSSEQKPLLLMGIMVPSGPFEDRTERRQRIRVALASAMAAGGYEPDDSERLGTFPVQLVRKHKASTGESKACMIPYEWFSPLSDTERRYRSFPSAYKRVLVFWIPDDVFSETPLSFLHQLRCQVQCSVPSLCKFDEAEFAIFGPWSSTTLKEIRKEADSFSIPHCEKNVCGGIPKFCFYNVFSTVPLHILFDETEWSKEPTHEQNRRALATLQDKLKEFSPTSSENKDKVFHYTTCPDSELAQAMKNELKRRGVNFENDRIAFIAESDTVYGRALPKTFRRGFIGEGEAKNVERFTYLRGLDGLLPQEVPKGDSGTPASSNPRMSIEGRFMPTRRTNRPEGNNQFDYIIRLGEEMKQRERQEGRFKVIGILGSDIYDKLLLLQALRPMFPNAVFFTTDLDAGYSHPQELSWTKNLLVASSHGLTLDDYYQCGIPPFRFSYQTAVFQAILGVTTNPKNKGESEHARLLDPSPARIFEIGWNKAYDISITNLTTIDADTIHPKRAVAYYSDILGKGINAVLFLITFSWIPACLFDFVRIAMLFFLFLIALFVLNWHREVFRILDFFFGWIFTLSVKESPPANQLVKEANEPEQSSPSDNREKDQPHFLYRLIGSFLVLPTLFLALIVYIYLVYLDDLSPAGEHWSWGSGISAWPSTTLRLFVFFLSAALLAAAVVRARKMMKELCNEYKLDNWEEKLRLASSQLWNVMTEFYTMIKDLCSTGSKEKKPPIAITFIWNDLGKEIPARIVLDILIWFVVSAAVLYLLACEGNGHLSYRSDESYWFGSVIWFIAWLATTALILATFLITRSCCRFIKKMETSTVLWNRNVPPNPDTVLSGFDERWERDIEWKIISPLIDVSFVETWTKRISNLVLYPVVSIALLYIAESAYFENYGENVYRYVVLVFMGLLIFVPAFQLRHAAGRLKAVKVKEARESLAYHPPSSEEDRRKIEFAIKETEGLRGGAFEPFLEHPFMQAILVLLGGISMPSFLNMLSNSF